MTVNTTIGAEAKPYFANEIPKSGRALWTFLIGVVPVSPLFSGILGIPIALSHVALCLFALALYGINRDTNIFRLAALWILYELVVSLLSLQPAIYLKQCVALLLCMLYATTLTVRDFFLLEGLLRKFIIFGLMLCYISFFAMLVAPITDPYSFPNPDGRLNYLFYFTFSNFWLGSFIRPSFIFDEPGAFATLIALWVLLAHSIDRFEGRTLIIASLGLITQSLALLFFLIIMLMQLRPRTFLFTFFILMLLGLIHGALPEQFQVFAHLLGRLDDIEGTSNRASQVTTVLDNLNVYSFFLGALATEGNEFLAQVDDVSSNPLTPLFNFGFYQSLPFYLGIGTLLVTAFRSQDHRVACLAFTAILLQRPYYADVGYSMLIFIVFVQLICPRWFAARERAAR